jgi:hypothetical protein
MMRDGNDAQSIRQDLKRWRNMLNADLEPDTKSAVVGFISGATTRLREIERRTQGDGQRQPGQG